MLPGITIGDNSIVGASSVGTKNIDPNVDADTTLLPSTILKYHRVLYYFATEYCLCLFLILLDTILINKLI